MNNGLKHSSKVTRAINATVAGTSTINGATIDTQEQRSTEFIVAMGTITATAVTSLKLQHGDLANASDMADLAGTAVAIADTESNKLSILEIVKPTKRYVRVCVVRSVANAVIDGAICIQNGAMKEPVTHDSTTVTASKQVVSPAAGTP